MTKEFYIIRQKTWHYSDQCYYLEKYGEEGAIYTTSFSYEEAKELWLKLERNAVREKLKFAELAFYDIIFNGDRDKEERFYDYLIDELKLPSDIREWDEITCFLFPPTNEQIDEIRKILGITFFVITQIENSNPNFYIPLALSLIHI